MLRSMTGFGRGEHQDEGKVFLVEIKTVNHRYNDVFIKMPWHISFLEDKVRELVLKNVSRGKVDVYISFEDHGEDSKSIFFDEPLAKTYIKALETLRDTYQLKDDITVSLVAKFPDVFKVQKNEEDGEKIWALLKVAVEKAIQSLVAMRESEGLELKNNLLDRAAYIEELLKHIIERAPNVVMEYKQRLENRIKELMEQRIVDENRIATEVAIFADRCSIDEEIVRLGSHIVQLRETLSMQQAIGRKLDFLIQEMNREINTIGSKANDLTITKYVVEIKGELEKVREQVQNIE